MKKLIILLGMLSAYLSSEAQSFVTFAPSTDTATNSGYSPFLRLSGNNANRYGRGNFILTQAELTQAGLPPNALITGVAFNKVSTDDFSNTGIYLSFWMKNESVTPTLPLPNTITWASIESSHTKVFSDSNYLPPSSPGWIIFNLQTPFLYTGNVLSFANEHDLAVSGSNPNSANPVLWQFTDGFNTHIAGAISTSIPAVLNGTLTNQYRRRPNIRIYYTSDPCIATTNVGTAVASNTELCTGSSFNLSLSGLQFGLGQTFQWQSSPDSISWTNITGATSAGVSLTQTALQMYYRCEVSCSSATGYSAGVRVNALQPLSGTYTVNAALPASPTNFTNFQDAINRLACVGLAGPTTLSLAPGTYSGNFNISSVPNTSALNTLTITSSTGNRNDVVFTRPGTTGNILSLAGVNHIIIRNISVVSTVVPTAAAANINTSAVTNVRIENCYLEAPDGAATTSSNNRNIYAASPTHELKVINSTIKGGYYGIYLVGSTSAGAAYMMDPFVKGNTITDFYYYGIYLAGTQGAIVDSNFISNPFATNASSYGIYINRALMASVRNNRLMNSIGAYGIDFTNVNSGNIYNNVLSFESATGVSRAISISGSTTDVIDTVDIVHNSIYLRYSTAATTVAGAINITGGSSTAPAFHMLRIINNSVQIEALPGSSTAVRPALYLVGAYHLTTLTSSNNNWFYVNQGNNPLFRVATTAYPDLLSYQTASSQEANSLLSDPGYSSTTDLTPAITGQLNAAAIPVPYVTTDINGTQRDLSNPDIGAIELVIPSRDLVLSSLVSPTLAVAAGSTVPVSVEIANGGTTLLTSAALSYQFNNGPIVSETFTGSLPFQQSTTFTFSTPLVLPSSGPLVLKVWGSNPNGLSDGNLSNDTILANLCFTIAAGTYSIGGTSPSFASFAEFENQLNCGGISGPVTINFHPGTYVLNATFGQFPNGTNSTLTFTSATGNSADVILTNGGTGSTFTLNGSSYITFANLKFKNDSPPAAGSAMISTSGSTALTVTSCTFEGYNIDSTTSANNLALVLVASSQSTIIGNNFSDLYYGISNNGGTPNYSNANQYILNNFSRIYHTPLYLQSESFALISQNVVTGVSGASTAGQGLYLLRAENTTIEGNRMTGLTGNYGFFLSNISGSATAPNRIYNNVISGELAGTTRRLISVTGNTSDGLDYLEIDHNSLEMISNHTSGTVAGTVHFLGGTVASPAYNGVKFRNNSVKTVMNGSSLVYTSLYFVNESITNVLESNYNNLFHANQAGPLVRIGTTEYLNLAAWQTATTKDVNSIFADPQYISSSNLDILPFSPNIGAATPLANITTDVLGNNRSSSSPDIGAYENFTLALNLFALASDRPSTSVLGGAIDTVSAFIKNLGTVTVNSFTASYQLGNGTVVSQLFNQTIPFGDTAYIVFSTPVNLQAAGSEVLRIWVSSPNGGIDEDFTNDTLNINLCVGLGAGTYTLGSPTSNFQTLTDLNAVLTCGGIVNGPVTIQVEFPGNKFAGQFVVPSIVNTSPHNTIHYVGNGDTIAFTPAATTNTPAIVLLGTNHATIDGFVVDMRSISGANTSGILLTDNASFNRITKNRVLMDRTVTAATLAGIASSGGVNSVTSATNANYNRIDSNFVSGAYFGIRLNGAAVPGSNISNQIVGNQVEDSYTYAIYLLQAVDCEIVGNEITRPSRTALGALYGVYLGTGTVGTRVDRNRIYNAHGIATSTSLNFYGVYSSSATATAANPNIISNNAIYRLANGGTGSMYGFYNSGSGFNYYYHNTVIIDNPASTSGASYGFYQTTSVPGIQLKNNIFYINRAGSGLKYGIYQSTAATQLETDHNAFWIQTPPGSTGLAHIGYRSSARTTMADWKAAGGVGTPYDSNSVAVNPDFINLPADNFTPSNVFLNNSGANLLAFVTQDLNGQNRSASPDMGALEFVPAGVDAAINSASIISGGNIYAPGVVCLTNLLSAVSIEVVNAGTLNLDSTIVFYQHNNGPVVTDTVFTSLSSAQVVTYVFRQQVQLLSGVNTLRVWAGKSGDVNTANDTVTVQYNIGVSTVLSVPHTDNFDSGVLPASLCVVNGANSNAEVLATGGSTSLNISGTHSLVLSGNASGTPWVTANNTNWHTLNPAFQTYVDYYVDASQIQRLKLSFKLLQLYRAANSTHFRVLVNGQPLAAMGRTTTDFIAVSAASNTDTMRLEYDLDDFVGDTVKITLHSNVRYNYAGAPPSVNIVDDLMFFVPADARFDSITAVTPACSPTAKTVAARIFSVPLLNTVSLKYTVNNGTTTSLPMTLSGNYYTATIPAAASGDTVRYFVETVSSTSITTVSAVQLYADDYLFINAGPDQTISVGDSAILSTTTRGGSSGGQGALLISEFMYYKGGSATTRQTTFPPYLPNTSVDDDYVEISNISTSPVNLAGLVVKAAIGTITHQLTFPTGAVLAPGAVAIIMPGTAANDIANNLYFLGGADNNEWLSSTSPAAVVLYESNGTTVIDAVRYNSADFPSSFGVPASEWPSNSNISGSASVVGLFRKTIFDTNSANDWSLNSADTVSSIGYLNRGYTLISNDTVGWSTLAGVYLGQGRQFVVRPTVTTTYVATYSDGNCVKRDTVTVFVNQQLPDVGVYRIVSPANGAIVNSPQTVTVMIRNFGQIPATGFDVSYRVMPGNFIRTNTILASIAAGDSLQHSFSEQWNPTQGMTFELCAFTLMPGDNNRANDTSCVTISNTTSTQNLGLINSVLYPNPATNQISIEINEQVEKGATLDIFDAMGRKVKTIQVDAGLSRIDVNIEGFASGAYSYRLEMQSKLSFGKFVKSE